MKLQRERTIVRKLREDSRKRIARVARETGIPRATINRWLKKQDVIAKFTVLPDFERLGYRFSALYFAGPKSNALKEFLERNRYVNNAYRIAGEYSYMFECIFSSVREMDRFERRLRRLRCGFRQHFIRREFGKEEFVP